MDDKGNTSEHSVELPPLITGTGQLDVNSPWVLAFWSSKGGVGKTTVALNTCAYISAMTELKTIIVDVAEFGEVGLSLGMQATAGGEPLPTVDDILENLEDIQNFEQLSPLILRETTTGLHVLLASPNSSNSLRPTKADYNRVLELLKKHFDIIAFDCGSSLNNDYIRLALTKADTIITVADQSYPALHYMSEVIHEFMDPDSGIGKERMFLVINRCQENTGMDMSELLEWFRDGVSDIFPIPFVDYAIRTANAGDFLILSGDEKVVDAYGKIAGAVLKKMHR